MNSLFRMARDVPSRKMRNANWFFTGWMVRFGQNGLTKWTPRAVYPPFGGAIGTYLLWELWIQTIYIFSVWEWRGLDPRIWCRRGRCCQWCWKNSQGSKAKLFKADCLRLAGMRTVLKLLCLRVCFFFCLPIENIVLFVLKGWFCGLLVFP